MKPGNSRPVDAAAARVVGTGIHHAYEVPSHVADSALPIPTTPVQNGQPDLTGVINHRLLVIGKAANAKGRWVCRCTCGTFCLRTTKAIRRREPDSCYACYMLATRKKSDYFRRTGRDSTPGEFL